MPADPSVVFEDGVDDLPELGKSRVGQSLHPAELLAEDRTVGRGGAAVDQGRGGHRRIHDGPDTASEGDVIVGLVAAPASKDGVDPCLVNAVVV